MKKFGLVLVILFSIHLWRYVGIDPHFFNYTDVLLIVVLVISMFKVVHLDNLRFKPAIFIFLIGIVLNIISARVNNGQTVMDSAFAFMYFLSILVYFYLHQQQISRKDLENFIIAFAVLYSIFYLRQEEVFPHRLFYGTMFANRGTIRIRMEGNGFLMLAYFLLLNRFLLQRKIWQIVLALFFFIVLLKSGFRTLTAGAVLMSGITFLALVKYSPVNYLMIVLATVLFIAIIQLPGYNYIITNMIETTEKQQDEGDDYIRRQQLEFFTKAYPKNTSYYIVGGGIPGVYGAYAEYMSQLVQRYGFYWVDLGLVGFYFVIGLVVLVGILSYSLKAVFIKLPPDGFYLKMYFAFLIVVSAFTTAEIYRAGIFSVEAIGLYLIDLYRNEYEQQKINS